MDFLWPYFEEEVRMFLKADNNAHTSISHPFQELLAAVIVLPVYTGCEEEIPM